MSNETFKNVKSVAEQFSDLSVTKDVTVHQRLHVKDLIATQVFNIPEGKKIEWKTFDFTAPATTAADISGASLDAVKTAHIVAAELTHDGGDDGSATVSIGKNANATDIFAGAQAGTRRVSSAFSQQLGSTGSADPVELPAGDELKAVGTAAVAGCQLKVYYYVDA